MNQRTLSLALIAFLFLNMISCSSDSDGDGDPDFCGTSWAVDLEDEINTFTTAGVAYATDPSDENCNAYKAAFQAYIDGLKKFSGCGAWTAQQKSEWQDVLDEAEGEIDGLCD
jgi:hypothetical protein